MVCMTDIKARYRVNEDFLLCCFIFYFILLLSLLHGVVY